MYKRTLILLSLLLIITGLKGFAQKNFQPNLKFGNTPTKEEWEITTCPYDKDAKAVILCSIVDVAYNYVQGTFKLEYNIKKRIKVLSQEGVDVANVSIPYYSSSDKSVSEEHIRSIKATAFNMVNGKLEKTKMGNNLIFEERIDKKHMRTKFTIPQVKTGTIIEYQYVKDSEFFYQIDDWYAQEDIPALYTSYEIEIPDILVFNLEQSGANHLQVSIQPDSRAYNLNAEALQTQCYKFIGQNIPALKADKYVWCPEMYANKVGFELRSIEIPGSYYKNFSSSWKDIDEALMKDDDFGDRIKRSNPLKEEMAAARIDTISNFNQKLATTFQLLHKYVKWNGSYALLGNSSRNVLKEGKASNADINFLLMNMLKTLNIKTTPLVLRSRNEGNLPLSHPSIESLNTFVVGIYENDSTMHVMDGSAIDGYIDILPPVLLTNAHEINGGQINLMKNVQERISDIVKAELKADGKLTGSFQKRYQNQASLAKKRAFKEAKDSTEYVKQIATDLEARILRYKLKNIRKFSPQVEQYLEFEKDGEPADVLYLSPILDKPFDKVPFIATERTMPVEFNAPLYQTYLAQIKLPNNYTLEETPQSVFLRNQSNTMSFKLQYQLIDNMLIVNYTFNIRKAFFAQNEYSDLKSFMEDVYNNLKAIVVLKKKEL